MNELGVFVTSYVKRLNPLNTNLIGPNKRDMRMLWAFGITDFLAYLLKF
jgi:hypothetical protein